MISQHGEGQALALRAQNTAYQVLMISQHGEGQALALRARKIPLTKF